MYAAHTVTYSIYLLLHARMAHSILYSSPIVGYTGVAFNRTVEGKVTPAHVWKMGILRRYAHEEHRYKALFGQRGRGCLLLGRDPVNLYSHLS